MAHSDQDSSSIATDENRGRRRWTLDVAKQVLAAFATSGLTLAAFAAREGLQLQRLYKWQRQLSEQAAPLKFAEVPVRDVSRDAPASADGVFEIVLGNGRIVRVGAGFEVAALQRLLSVVDGER